MPSVHARVNRILGFVLVVAGLLSLPRPAEAAAGEHTALATSTGGQNQFVEWRVTYWISIGPGAWLRDEDRKDIVIPYHSSQMVAPGYFLHKYIKVTGGFTSGHLYEARYWKKNASGGWDQIFEQQFNAP